MKLFTPFTIPQKENCDLCRIKSNKRREAEMVEEGKLRTESRRSVYVSDLVGVENHNHDQKILNKELPLGKLMPMTENYQKKNKEQTNKATHPRRTKRSRYV